MIIVESNFVSACGKYKVEIERQSNCTFHVVTYKWIEEIVPDYGKIAEFWAEVSSATFTDTLENANNLALEKLEWLSDPQT